jgi:hypothetical protein
MNEFPDAICTTRDALLWCDYMARFATGDLARHADGMGAVIRFLMRRAEEQTMKAERAEAQKGNES